MIDNAEEVLGTIRIRSDSGGTIPWLAVVRDGKGKNYLRSEAAGEAEERIEINPRIAWRETLGLLPLAAAIWALGRLEALPGQSLLVIGLSPWGEIFTVAGEIMALLPITRVAEPGGDEDRKARERHRAESLVLGDRRTMDGLKEATGGRGYDLVVETTALPEGIKLALGAAGIRGKVGLIGRSPGPAVVDLHNSVHYKELSVYGLWTLLPPSAAIRDGVNQGIIDAFRKAVEREAPGLHPDLLKRAMEGFEIVTDPKAPAL